MKTSTKMVYAMMTAGLISGSISAKDLYISADGNDSNNGLSASQPRATLTSLNDIIAQGDVIHVSGMIDMTKEIALGDGIDDKNLTWGHYISYNSGKHNGFYINGSNTTIDGKTTPWKNITITGSDPEEDGFDGGEAMRIFYVRGDNKNTTVTFKNLTIRNGLAPQEGGGAIFNHDNGWIEIENCVFENNHLDYKPLTEEVQASGDVKLKSSTSERGGAIYTQTGKLTVTDSKFYNNHNRRGGALIATGGIIKVTRCDFDGNGADIDGKYLDDSRGGAVHLWPLNIELSAAFDHCNFENNTTWNSAGALYLQSNTDGSNLLDVVFTNCSFINNETIDGQGGAVVVANAENYGSKDDKLKHIYATFANTSFFFNRAKSEGGAFYMAGGIYSDKTNTGDELRMINCTMAKNETKGNAGHGAGYCEGIANNLFSPGNTDRYFYNCLFEQNEAPMASNGKGEYSDLLPLDYFYTDHSYYGRIMFTKVSEQNFYDALEGAGISKDNIWHGDHSANIEENEFDLSLSEDAIYAYDYSGCKFKFITLDEGSELLEKGDPQYLAMPSREVAAVSGKKFTLQGYDISASDQMGFPRKNGKCAVGAMEISTQEADQYYDDMNFPYLEDNGSSSAIGSVISDAAAINYSNGVATANGSHLTVYNISGLAVASADDAIDLSRLAKGVYIVKATGNAVESTLKVVR